MTRIVILTGSELRHVFFRKYMALSPDVDVIATYCEGLEKSVRTLLERDSSAKDMRSKHLSARERSEADCFGPFVERSVDRSNPVHLPKGALDLPRYAQAIIDAQPDLLIAYGCSIVREPLLSAFKGRFLNVHLGISPYYRGSATNYWPLVNGEPEYVGATFMHIDAGVDTGEIIHQIRAQCSWGDTPSTIGNRLIEEMTRVYERIIVGFPDIGRAAPQPGPVTQRVYRKADYTEESVATLYRNFAGGLIERYLREATSRWAMAPIVTNPDV